MNLIPTVELPILATPAVLGGCNCDVTFPVDDATAAALTHLMVNQICKVYVVDGNNRLYTGFLNDLDGNCCQAWVFQPPYLRDEIHRIYPVALTA